LGKRRLRPLLLGAAAVAALAAAGCGEKSEPSVHPPATTGVTTTPTATAPAPTTTNPVPKTTP
jgi:predicted outer membrane protein